MSVLDDLGEEVTGILAPVSLCMALTVALVKAVNPTGESNRESVPFATAYYDEQVLPVFYLFLISFQESDSIWTKLSGSVINALIFVVIIGAMTFVLFCLFKYQVPSKHFRRIHRKRVVHKMHLRLHGICIANDFLLPNGCRCDRTVEPHELAF